MLRCVAFLTAALAVACGESAPADPLQPNDPEGVGGQDGNECSAAGESRCDGTLVQLCTEGPGGLVWGEPEPCPGDQRCRESACADPSAAQLAQLASAEAYVEAMVSQAGWPDPIDGEALLAEAKGEILDGDGSTPIYLRAMRSIHLGVRQGHQTLYDGSCAAPLLPLQSSSRFGVCGRPHGDALVVTYARAGNALGVAPGDRVVSAGGVGGAEMLEEAARRPMCGASSPTDSHRRTAAASTFFASVPAGTELVVEPAGGGRAYPIVVPDEHDPASTSCQDPLGRDIAFNASSYIRPDGVAVVHLPRFFPIDKSLPPNPTQQQYEELLDHMVQAVLDAFEPVKDAPALVWDVRSNGGGLTAVGLQIVAGMPTAKATQLSYCQARIPGSDPPAFSAQKYALYEIVPGGPFAYAGKVAVLVDGLDYSAADYFPYAVAHATDSLLVGSVTAGAYGATSVQLDLAGPPLLYAGIDVNRCADVNGEPLEGRGVVPDLVVEYEPTDLAAGVDTVMEAAVAQLLSQ